MNEQSIKETRGHIFVRRVIALCEKDNGIAAALRRADNPYTENQSWAYLCACGVNIEKDWERRPAALIAAAVAKADGPHDDAVGRGDGTITPECGRWDEPRKGKRSACLGQERASGHFRFRHGSLSC